VGNSPVRARMLEETSMHTPSLGERSVAEHRQLFFGLGHTKATHKEYLLLSAVNT